MKLIAFLILGLTAWLLAAPVQAQDLTYWGKTPGAEGRGWIKFGEQYVEVGEGQLIPGWGTVRAITDDALIIQRPLSEQEQQWLREQGRAVYDAQEIRFRNLSRRLMPR